MRKSIFLIILITLTLSADLTKQQLQKLNSPVVKDQNGTLVIEEYNKVTFTKPVLFDNKKLDKIIIKTKATMKKGTIHKEQFIAISSSISDQMIQSVLFSPEYFDKLKTSELLVSKPMQNPNLNVEIVFLDKGIDTKLFNRYKKIEHFIPYNELFLTKMKP